MMPLNVAAAPPSAMTNDIVTSIRDGIVTVDHAGRLTFMNPAAETIFGLRAETVVGETVAEVFVPLDGLDTFTDCVLEAVRNPEAPHEADVTIESASGRRHLTVHANLLRDKDSSETIGILVVVSDISERVESLERSAARERERAAIGRFIVAILTIFSVFTLLLEPIQKLAEARFFDFGPVLALVTLMVIAFLITRWTGSSLRDYGVTLRLGRRDLYESVAWSVAVCILMTAIKGLTLQLSPASLAASSSQEPLFAFLVLDDGTRVDTVDLFAIALAIYLFSVLFQEFATRCAIQAPLTRFLDGVVAAPGWIANITATLLFAVLHAHLNPVVSLAVIGPSLLWGWLFMRSGSVASPILSHTIIGVYAIFILGLFAGVEQV
ncbi:type II CAAX endopeptidase family protein [Roseospira visakhapatnamensis]|uniref:PAS domain S-box-containing protein n=1 Tax=Roseospira visakhapatnamensis TaxID=390880 RepID=A0A7W6RB38_9PROT|nr:type II CAAX endopeptidase family protein [Roseospira visakhapatnamensis]MBB4265253.1 PAS domain S-box-containing protein [Roseospira visakhapatnamensis]